MKKNSSLAASSFKLALGHATGVIAVGSAAAAILRVLTVTFVCISLVNPHYDLEPEYITRKPIVHRI